MQNVVPTSFCSGMLDLVAYILLVGHPGECGIYVGLRQEFHWHYTVTDVYTAVNNCTAWSRRGTKFEHQRNLEFYLTASSLGFVPIDIFEPRPRTKAGNQFVVNMTRRYIRERRAIAKTRTLSKGANTFFNDWIVFYEVLHAVLFDIGETIFSKCLTTLCVYLGTKKRRVAASQPQTTRKVESYSKTLVPRLQLYSASN